MSLEGPPTPEERDRALRHLPDVRTRARRRQRRAGAATAAVAALALAIILSIALAGCSTRRSVVGVSPATTTTEDLGVGPPATSSGSTATSAAPLLPSTTAATPEAPTVATHQVVPAVPPSRPNPRSVDAGDTANGQQLTLHVGDHLTVALASTYWAAPSTSAPAVLQPSGSTVTPTMPCVPGGGCGTSSTTFVAVATGTATVVSNRTSCGEALLCSPSQRSYSLTVVVTPP